jgi:epoxyqueuosine reductase
MQESTKSAEWVKSIIAEFVAGSPENTLRNPANDKAFENPLVGFSKCDDPLYKESRTFVGPFHWTPRDIFAIAFPFLKIDAGDLTVISWILPQTEATKSDNRKQSSFPSDRWARARIYGEEFNNKIRKHIVESLTKEGYEAVAPVLLPQWEMKKSEQFVYSSTWSERHAAYIAGLGTFGLCDGLITSRGKALRIGSVVARIKIPPTPRPYNDHHAYCLFFTQGICGICIKRCPVQAIGKDGHDKLRCAKYLKPATADYVKSNYGFDGYGCGLCQTGVPCESKIPMEEDVKAYLSSRK